MVACREQMPARMVFDMKNMLKQKARLVTRGDMTEPPCDLVCSGLASLCSLCIVVFLAELNALEITGGNIGNAHLEAHTEEKACFRAGLEFRPLERHLLLIDKAFHGVLHFGCTFPCQVCRHAT